MEEEWTDMERSAWWALLRSSTLLLRNLGDAVRADGIPFEWFDVLINIRQYPEGTMPLSTLAENVVLSRSGLTRLLDRMEKAGLIERRLSSEDRRRFDVVLTEAGRSELQRVWPRHVEEVRQRYLKHLTGEEMGSIHAALARVIQANEAG